MAYNKFKDLEKRTQSDIVLKNKALKTASNPKYNGYERRLARWFINFLTRNQKELVLKMKLKKINNCLMSFINQLLGNLKDERSMYHHLMALGGVDLADMQLISKYIKGIRYLLCVIDLISKYAWVVPVKDCGLSIVNAFQSILKKSNRKTK